MPAALPNKLLADDLDAAGGGATSSTTESASLDRFRLTACADDSTTITSSTSSRTGATGAAAEPSLLPGSENGRARELVLIR